MKKKLSLVCKSIFLIIAIITAISRCSSKNAQVATSKSQLTTLADFINLVKSAGYEVKDIKQTTKTAFLVVPPKIVTIDNFNISVFEYRDENTANNEAKSISKDGGIIGNSAIDWVNPPHFYQKGEIIVYYSGTDNKILNMLRGILGNPIGG